MYFKSVVKENMTYSVDMLRLRTDLTFEQFREIEFRFDTYFHPYLKKYYQSFGCADFKYNFVVQVGEGQSFWFGFYNNMETPSQSDSSVYNFTIEFNPNKIKDNSIIMYLLRFSRKWTLKSLDLAIDVPISVVDIAGLDKKRYHDIRTISAGFDNKTIYIGRGDNRIKIYNKKIESNLEIQGELTRIEISSKFDNRFTKRGDVNLNVYNMTLPEIYTNDYFYTFKDYEDKTLLCILHGVQAGFPLSYLTRTYRKKVENLLKGGHILPFSQECCTKIIKETLSFYLEDIYLTPAQKYIKYDDLAFLEDFRKNT